MLHGHAFMPMLGMLGTKDSDFTGIFECKKLGLISQQIQYFSLNVQNIGPYNTFLVLQYIPSSIFCIGKIFL
jgi:hypothetical protein